MLSRSSASGASRSQSRELLRTFTRPTGSRQLRGAASRLTPTQQRTLVQSTLPLVTSKTLANRKNTPEYAASKCQPQRRFVSSPASAETPQPSEPIEADDLNTLVDRISSNEAEMVAILEELELMEDDGEADELIELLSQRDAHTAESWVHTIKQRFGDEVPAGFLNDAELQIYARLYGEPIIRQEFDESMLEEEDENPSLLREDGQGGWEEVELDEDAIAEQEIPVVYDMDIPPEERETIAMQRTREVAEQLGGEIMLEEFENEAVPDSAPRMHPSTLEGKFGTDPTTIHLPKSTLTGPISVILSNYSNKHIAETAQRLFGGPGLPHSTTVAPPKAQLQQLPIPLHASQRHMGEMEANTYLAALYPGIYASTLSVMVEIRKRLGSDWIRRLLSQEGGPNVLDASGGGAGILAWRDIIRTEWELMVPDHPEGAPIPFGRSAVVTGSDALRLRAATMLENTTFLPRLPDYVHVRGKATIEDSRKAPKRKQYDVLIAPHSLLDFEEEYERKQHVENLWSLLNPNGGVLILLEKGRQKGFEAISGAREMLLKRHIASPESTEYDNFLEDPDQREVIEKERGMIVAPCTNHSTCPMHNSAGATKGRRDYCHFQQRYIRPQFLQRIMGAKDRNHEDLKFSYLAVQRGVDLRQDQGISQTPEATDAAFEGFESKDPQESEITNKTSFNPLSLPRTVFPPMKRRGHVILDLCTPAGKIERWTVPRSYSRQAYRDARKSYWGDLWALGAKTRIPRNLNLGDKHGEGKKERLARRAANRLAEEEGEAENEGEEEEGDEDEDYNFSDIPETPMRKRGQRIPSWKKHNDTKKLRQAHNKRDTE